MREVSKHTNRGGGRSKAGDVLFLMKLMEGEIDGKKLPANSLKRVIYEKAIVEQDMKIINKIIDKLYANKQDVDILSDGKPFQITINS